MPAAAEEKVAAAQGDLRAAAHIEGECVLQAVATAEDYSVTDFTLLTEQK